MRAVIDTNVVLVANDAHDDVSAGCVLRCIDALQTLMRQGVVVIDDAYRILSEYQHRTTPIGNKRVGDVFVRWLLRNSANPAKVEQVALTETGADEYQQFTDLRCSVEVDASDRKFLAVAAAHPARPPVWQATDSKWLDWWQGLGDAGITIRFMCPDDVCRFYRRKFPDRALPPLP